MEPAGRCAAHALAPLLRRQPLSQAKVRLAWTATVGAAASRATVVGLHADGTLAVTAGTDHWRRETARASSTIRARLASLLGPDVVKRIAVTEGPPHA